MRSRVVRLAIALEGGVGVLALGVGWLVGFPPFERLYLTWQALALGVVATFPPLVGMWRCTRLQFAPFLRLMHEVEDKLIPLFSECSHFEIILICLLAGVCEEALFRGVIQTALAEWLSPWWALLVASMLFGLGHLITPTYAILASLLGLYMGGLFMLYGNLLVVIVAHAFYDYVALIYLVNEGRGKTGR